MLQSLTIEKFKGFNRLCFSSLKRINLITGKNNTGKTGVLEALLALLETGNAFTMLPTSFRACGNLKNATESFWQWLFYNHNTSQPAIISADTEKFTDYSVAISMGPAPAEYFAVSSSESVTFSSHYPICKTTGRPVVVRTLPFGAVPLSTRPTDPEKDAVDFDQVVLKHDGEKRLENLLREIDPRLKTVRSIKPHGTALLYVDMGLSHKIPAIHLGQGFVRLLSIYSRIIASDKKVLLIDEFENGLHHSVLGDVWKGVLQAMEQEQLQVFATTHSYECIRAAHNVFAQTKDYDFALHRLEKGADDIQVVTYDKETLETSLNRDFETR